MCDEAATPGVIDAVFPGPFPYYVTFSWAGESWSKRMARSEVEVVTYPTDLQTIERFLAS